MLKNLFLLLTICCSTLAHAGTITGQLQGPSGLAVKNATLTFTLQQAGLLIGTGNIAALSSSCYTSIDGTVVGLPNPLTLPSTAITYGSGTMAAGTYYVAYAFLDASGNRSLASPELQVQLTGTGSLIVSPPPTFPPNAVAMTVYVGPVSGQETAQGNTSSPTGSFTQSVTPTTTTTLLPTVNTSPCQIAFNDTIIPYTGYNVSLVSSGGNAYPGWPQAWQLNGGLAGTINVSAGAPLWNGVTVFPQPILAQPLNHGPQSISGPLDFGGYNVNDVGTLTAGTINTVINATVQTGTDIGAKVNTAGGAPCSGQCEIYIPAGNYSFSTPISLPMNGLGAYALELDPGAVLTYTGSGCAITEYIATASPTTTNVRIHGGHLYGTSAAQCGIHVEATNAVSISGISVYGFTAGYGIWVDGANQVNIFDSLIQLNQVGVYASNTVCSGNVCSPTSGSGTPFSPNAVHLLYDTITGNSQWGVQFYDAATNGQTGALNPVIAYSDLELNGSAGSTYGAISVGRSSSGLIVGNYLEGSPRELVLGFPGSPGSFFSTQGMKVLANHFTVTNGTLYQIEAQDTVDLNVDGNSTLTASVANSGSCFLNETEATGTFYGKNHIVTGASGSTGTISPLCQAGTAELALAGAGSYSQTNGNYAMQAVNVNYAITSSGTSETVATGGAVKAGSSCTVGPYNAAAGATALASYYIPTGANTGTLYHPASVVGQEVSIFCAPGPFN